MFVSIHHTDTPDNSKMQQWLQRVYSEQWDAVAAAHGTISRLQIDDKGVVTKSVFGLAGVHSLEEDRSGSSQAMALKAAFEIKKRLAKDSPEIPGGVQVKIGVATGTIFAGVVGSDLRCEYTSVGFTVNLAARLMQRAGDSPARVVCDAATQVSALLDVGSWLDFGDRQNIMNVKGAIVDIDAYFPTEIERDDEEAGDDEPEDIGLGFERRTKRLDSVEEDLDLGTPGPSSPDGGGIGERRPLVNSFRMSTDGSASSVDEPLVGRVYETQAVRKTIAKLGPDTNSRLLLITGLPGAGKTAMIDSVVRQAARNKHADFHSGSWASAGGAYSSGESLSMGCFRNTLKTVLQTAYDEWDVERSCKVQTYDVDDESFESFLRRKAQDNSMRTAPLTDAVTMQHGRASLGSIDGAKFLYLLNNEDVLPPRCENFTQDAELLSSNTTGKLRDLRLRAVFSLLLDVFLSRPAVIAIDEAQYMDGASYQLIRELLVSKNDEFCIKNEEFCIKNEKLCIKNILLK